MPVPFLEVKVVPASGIIAVEVASSIPGRHRMDQALRCRRCEAYVVGIRVVVYSRPRVIL